VILSIRCVTYSQEIGKFRIHQIENILNSSIFGCYIETIHVFADSWNIQRSYGTTATHAILVLHAEAHVNSAICMRYSVSFNARTVIALVRTSQACCKRLQLAQLVAENSMGPVYVHSVLRSAGGAIASAPSY
jgi:hypothetical protein